MRFTRTLIGALVAASVLAVVPTTAAGSGDTVTGTVTLEDGTPLAGVEVFLFDPVLCPSCLLKWCDLYSTVCVNCGGGIPPYSQVGVLKAEGGNMEFVHMTAGCWTVGSAFHGYWGKHWDDLTVSTEAFS